MTVSRTTQDVAGQQGPARGPVVRRRLVALVTGLLAVAAALTGAGVVLTGAVLAGTPAAAASPVRIMPLGDSITGSPGCWRALLWQRLQANGFTNIDMVGTQPPQGCSVPYDGDHEGHGGALATTTADSGALVTWLAATHPDVVMMHFGTNDVWSARPTSTILAAFSTLVDQMRASNPAMKILVAQIIPMNPSTCTDCAGRVVQLNAAIPAWAAGKSTAQSPITVVDQWTGFVDATDTADGVHPNAAGDQKMSDHWYPALSAALGGPAPSTTSTTSTTSTSRTTSSTSSTTSTSTSTTSGPGAATCTVAYSVTNRWPGGFQGQVVVTDPGPVALKGWTISWTTAPGESVTQVWGGTATVSASGVTVTSPSWSSALPVGGTATVGFIGTATGTPATPAVTCRASV